MAQLRRPRLSQVSDSFSDSKMQPISGSEKLYLVGFRIDPEQTDPQVYTVYVDDERPILRERRPLLSRPDLASRALRESDCGAASLGPAPQSYTQFLTLPTPKPLQQLNQETRRLYGELLNCINAIFDFVPFFADPMPEQYRSALRRLADHITFHKQFAEVWLIKEQEISRVVLTDALFWSLGPTRLPCTGHRVNLVLDSGIMVAMKRTVLALSLLWLLAGTAPATGAFLGETPPVGESFPNTTCLRVSADVSRELSPGSGGSCLERPAECFVAPNATDIAGQFKRAKSRHFRISWIVLLWAETTLRGTNFGSTRT